MWLATYFQETFKDTVTTDLWFHFVVILHNYVSMYHISFLFYDSAVNVPPQVISSSKKNHNIPFLDVLPPTWELVMGFSQGSSPFASAIHNILSSTRI